MFLGIEEACNYAAIGDWMRAEALRSALAFDERQRGGHVFNRNIKRYVAAVLLTGAAPDVDAQCPA